MEYFKLVAYIAPITFAIYSVYNFNRQSFWKSAGTILKLRWGRTVTYDLYLGVFILCTFMSFHHGLFTPILMGLFPTYLFGNLATLVGLIIYYDSSIIGLV